MLTFNHATQGTDVGFLTPLVYAYVVTRLSLKPLELTYRMAAIQAADHLTLSFLSQSSRGESLRSGTRGDI